MIIMLLFCPDKKMKTVNDKSRKIRKFKRYISRTQSIIIIQSANEIRRNKLCTNPKENFKRCLMMMKMKYDNAHDF
jgi:hypothetical protein